MKPRWLLLGILLATFIARPTPISASTKSEAPPRGCAFAIPTVVTSTPVAITGPIPTAGALVDVQVYGSDKRVHEVSVTTTSDAWRTVLLFDVADAGSWTIRVSIDGGPPCESPITVVLPAGVVAEPTPVAGAEPEPQAEATSGLGGVDIRGLAAEAFAVLVAASWIFLLVVGIAAVIGARPLSRPWWHKIAVPATFVAILGGFLAVALVADLMVSLSHFDTGTPPDQQAWLDAGIWAMALVGSVVGAVAAVSIHVRTGATHPLTDVSSEG